MFSRSHPLRSPDGNGGAPSVDHARDSYVALVRVLHDPPTSVPLNVAIGICASNCANNLIPALYRGTTPVEVALKYLNLKNPQSGVNVFLETRHLAPLVARVAEFVQERIAKGGGVSDYVLASLRGYIVSPNDIGSEVSVAAYKAFMTGLTRCYVISVPDQLSQPEAPDPLALISLLGAELRRGAARNPQGIADVVTRIANVPVNPLLSPVVDSMLSRLSEVDAFIPHVVREAALQGIARRAQG